MEYSFIQNPFVIPARCCFFYEPAPAENTPDDYYGITFGTGLSFKAYHFDLAYEFRFGRNVGKDIANPAIFEILQDINEHSFYSSFIYHF